MASKNAARALSPFRPRGTARQVPTAVTGTFTRYASLVESLPPLVKIQRRLAARIASVANEVIEEKALRATIDGLLVRAGLTKSEVVTCAGYDVRHNEKAGSTSLNSDKLTEQLVAGGVDRAFVAKVLVDSTETGETSRFATVTPSKGAKVQPPEKLTMAKATTRTRA